MSQRRDHESELRRGNAKRFVVCRKAASSAYKFLMFLQCIKLQFVLYVEKTVDIICTWNKSYLVTKLCNMHATLELKVINLGSGGK